MPFNMRHLSVLFFLSVIFFARPLHAFQPASNEAVGDIPTEAPADQPVPPVREDQAGADRRAGRGRTVPDVGRRAVKPRPVVPPAEETESGDTADIDPKDEAKPVARTPGRTEPVSRAPASVEEKREIDRLEQSGDLAAARKMAVETLERHPEDKDLLAFVKMTAPVKAAVDAKTVKARAAELAAGMRQDEGSGGAILASPISFGALAGARGSAAPPAGLGGAVPDMRGAAVLRDASGKIAIKDYAGAEWALMRRIEEAPNDGAALRLRALARRFLNHYADSADDAKRALALDGRDARSLHLLSRDLTDLGRPREALAEADRALALDNKDAQAYVARAAAFGALGRGEEELADLARAASLDSQFDSLYHDTLAVRGGGAVAAKSARSWPVWLGAIGTALLFFSFALFRKRGDSSVRMALRQEDHDELVSAAPRVGAVPKGFRVVKILGQGGMGVVYEAVDLALQRTVALKKLRPEVADNLRERTRFLKEARTVAGLKHPNIVEIHAIHEDAEGLFLVFERVPGESLHERLGRGPVAPAEAAAFLKQIAAALDYAHAQGVVHQDLKPGNVMIHAGLAKVMDFGIARRVLETLSTMSKVEVSGTPAYMSPEQEQCIVTPSADIYALGVCAYESLTGVLPFPTGGLMLKAQKMYRRPSEAMPALKSGVDAAIGRALEPRPEDRWPSASSFVDALARALS